MDVIASLLRDESMKNGETGCIVYCLLSGNSDIVQYLVKEDAKRGRRGGNHCIGRFCFDIHMGMATCLCACHAKKRPPADCSSPGDFIESFSRPLFCLRSFCHCASRRYRTHDRCQGADAVRTFCRIPGGTVYPHKEKKRKNTASFLILLAG